MGRFRDASDEEDETAIDMSPLIDCVFILLIFFIVTTVFVEETGVEVKKPQAAAASSDLEKNSILIAITEEGDVIYDKKNFAPNGIGPLIKRLLLTDPEMPVIIQADKGSKHDIFAQVYQEAQTSGATKISFATAIGR